MIDRETELFSRLILMADRFALAADVISRGPASESGTIWPGRLIKGRLRRRRKDEGGRMNKMIHFITVRMIHKNRLSTTLISRQVTTGK